jgi:hypothetical protein
MHNNLFDIDDETLNALASCYTENFDLTGVRPVPLRLYYCLILDVWPTRGAVDDFGIDSVEHYGALQYAVKHDGVTPQQLDAACCRGPSIQALISPENPFGSVAFRTLWDDLLPPPDPGESALATTSQQEDEE